MLVDNKIYVNKSLEPVIVNIVNEKHDIKYIATRIKGSKSYVVGSFGVTITKRNQIIDIGGLNLIFNDKNIQYITDTFNIIYCNSNQDWFRRSDFKYGLEIVKLRNNDIRFIDTKNGQTIPMRKIKSNSNISKQLEFKYFELKKILTNS